MYDSTTIHHPSCPTRQLGERVARQQGIRCIGCHHLDLAAVTGWTPSQLPPRTENQMVLDILAHASAAREGL